MAELTVTVEQPEADPATQTQIIAAPAPAPEAAAPVVALEVGQLMERVEQLSNRVSELSYKVESAESTAAAAIRIAEEPEPEQEPEPVTEQLDVVEVVPVAAAQTLEDQPAPGEKKKSLLRRFLMG